MSLGPAVGIIGFIARTECLMAAKIESGLITPHVPTVLLAGVVSDLSILSLKRNLHRQTRLKLKTKVLLSRIELTLVMSLVTEQVEMIKKVFFFSCLLSLSKPSFVNLI